MLAAVYAYRVAPQLSHDRRFRRLGFGMLLWWSRGTAGRVASRRGLSGIGGISVGDRHPDGITIATVEEDTARAIGPMHLRIDR